MFGSVILDVAVGMVYIYLVLSLVASVINEGLASLVQSRAANLERGLRSLLSGDSIEAGALTLVDNIYNHGLIRGLYPDPEKDLGDTSGPNWWSRLRLWLQKKVGIAPGKAIADIKNPLLLPSYIPARAFALAMIDILNKDKFNGKAPIENIEAFLVSHHQQFAKNKAVEALLALLIDAKNDAKNEKDKLQRLQSNLENWYNDAMDRVSGWYKRYTQKVLLVVGLVIAIAFNVDSIRIAKLLWMDRDARTGMANAATDYWKAHQPAVVSANQQTTGQTTDQTTATNVSGSQTDQQPAGQQTNTQQQANAQQPAVGSPTATPASTSQTSEADLAARLRSSVEAFNAVAAEFLLPVGWQHHWSQYWCWWIGDPLGMLGKGIPILLGWLITAGALSLGASFWFDTLNRIMVIRNTVKPQEKSQPEESKDN